MLCPSATWALQTFTTSRENANSGKAAVWIKSHMREGSSTILSMMSATMDDNQDATDVFSVYEPCHKLDNYSDSMTAKLEDDISHCSDLVMMLANCDFSQVVDMHHWTDAHMSNGHTSQFSQSVAENLCNKAGFVAVKTVWP